MTMAAHIFQLQALFVFTEFTRPKYTTANQNFLTALAASLHHKFIS